MFAVLVTIITCVNVSSIVLFGVMGVLACCCNDSPIAGTLPSDPRNLVFFLVPNTVFLCVSCEKASISVN